jgi:hypothetical protein
MNGIQGIRLPHGGTCLVGDIPFERYTRCVSAGNEWPWQTPVMQGDVRCAVAWPDRNVGKTYRDGCLALAVVDPVGMMRVVTMQKFDRTGTTVDDRGKMVEGLAQMLANVRTWGIEPVMFQSDDMANARMWLAMIRKDASMGGLGVRVEPSQDIDACLCVFKQMENQIIFSSDDLAKIGEDEASGIVNPMMKAAAMLAASYKFITRPRLEPENRRWEKWE